jgi:hypothetical protein
VLRPEAAANPAGPQFLPQPRFAELRGAAAETRATALREALLRAWDDSLTRPDGAALQQLAEHGEGVDPSSVFLARVRLPATPAEELPPPAEHRPEFDLDALIDDHIDNLSRSFVLPNDLIAALIAA